MHTATDVFQAPARRTRRAADKSAGRSTRDRLSSMAMLAALLHGLIILGVSFAPPDGRPREAQNALEVLLVSEELPETQVNPGATYISQRTQQGSGNTDERLRATQASRGGLTPSLPTDIGVPTASQTALTTSSTRPMSRVTLQPVTQELQLSAEEISMILAEEATKLRGKTRENLQISADTQASRLAPYLDSWRRRVERVGTANYPVTVAMQSAPGNPIIEVSLAKDGKMRSARIAQSSGQDELDAAALNILRLASPFEPFPPEMAKDYHSLRFAYEWRFER